MKNVTSRHNNFRKEERAGFSNKEKFIDFGVSVQKFPSESGSLWTLDDFFSPRVFFGAISKGM